MTKQLLRRPSVAVVGAGLAGLACARALAAAGLAPVVFEKSRGLGGRLATRRGASGAFDHGAPLVEGPAEALAEIATAAGGAAVAWALEGRDGLVGAPGMSDLARPLAEGLTIRRGVEVAALARGPEDTVAIDADGARHGPFAVVLLAIPGPQAARLAGEAAPSAEFACAYRPVLSALLTLAPDAASGLDRLGPADASDPIALALREGVKPGRFAAGAERWVVHAEEAWSRARLEDDKTAIGAALGAAFSARVGVGVAAAEGHRWRYATVARPVGRAAWLSEDGALGLCGDWRLGRTAGHAWASGRALAALVSERLGV